MLMLFFFMRLFKPKDLELLLGVNIFNFASQVFSFGKGGMKSTTLVNLTRRYFLNFLCQFIDLATIDLFFLVATFMTNSSIYHG
jgi:hypothetical protein